MPPSLCCYYYLTEIYVFSGISDHLITEMSHISHIGTGDFSYLIKSKTFIFYKYMWDKKMADRKGKEHFWYHFDKCRQ